MLFAINGHLMLVRGFLMTFEAVPISGLSMQTVAELFTRNLAIFFVSAVEIAGPILAALFLAEVVLGLLARAAPMMNVFALAFPFKILLTLMLLGVTLPLVVRAVSTLVNTALIEGLSVIGG
jgi:flagellar biosynthetic protein FliR